MQIGVLYYMNEEKNKSLSSRVLGILQAHIQRYGLPNEVLISNKNIGEKVQLPPEMQLVVSSVRLPANHVWMEIDDPKGEE